MKNEIDIYYWNSIKQDIKDMYPKLSDSDLLWRDGGTFQDLLKEIATRLGISWRELEIVINDL